MKATFQERQKKTMRNLQRDCPPLAASLERQWLDIIEKYQQAGAPYGVSADPYEMYDKALLWLGEMRGLSVVGALCRDLSEVWRTARQEQRGLTSWEVAAVKTRMLETFAALEECRTGEVHG